MKKIPPLLLTFLVSATAAQAQQLYKSVGPDGKVVYSDRPIDGKTKVATMQGTIVRPATEPAQAQARTAPRTLVPVPESVVTPEIEQTMLRVMELAEFGRRYQPICAVNEQVARTFAQAHKAWMTRNALYVEQQKRLLMEVVSPGRRLSMQQRLMAGAQSAIKPTASANARMEWCATVISGLNSGTSDIVMPAMLAIPLTAYRDK